MANLTTFTPSTRAKFLNALEKGASVAKAAKAAGWSRTSAYNYREAEEAFAAEWDAAIETGTDAIEDEALRRATKGTLKPVFYKGTHCGDVREYSDTLTVLLLKARRREKYSERHEHTGKDGEAIQAAVVRVPLKATLDEWKQNAAEHANQPSQTKTSGASSATESSSSNSTS